MRIAQLCLRHVPSPLEKAAPFPLLVSPCSRIDDMLDCSPAEAPILLLILHHMRISVYMLFQPML